MAAREDVLVHLVAQQAIGLVVAPALLVLDDAALVIELLLRHRTEQIAHAIAFEHQHAVDRGGRNGFEIIGAVGIGGAVEAGRADLLERLEEVAIGVFRTVEHQVFEQVGETGLALGFVLGADIVPDRDRNQRGLAIGVDHGGQAVGEREDIVRDADFVDELGKVAALAGRRGSGGGCRSHRGVPGRRTTAHSECGDG